MPRGWGQKRQRPRVGLGRLVLGSGAEGSRTLDLVIANDALYQLSYRPSGAEYSREKGKMTKWQNGKMGTGTGAVMGVGGIA